MDEIEKIFREMQATNMEGVNFTAYQLKDMAYQYKAWDRVRGNVEESTLWETFSNAFLDRFFP